MLTTEYTEADASGLAALLRRRDVSPNEVLRTAHEAIEAVNSELNALAAPLFPEPLGAAADAPFTGVPMLLKDFGVEARGVTITMGSRAVEARPGEADSELITQIKRSGLVVMGRTTVPEFALHAATESLKTGATRNPWDPTVTPGGSSGGSAALVAAGAVPVAHGTDAGGSIRQPAACCGIVGLKPSSGRVPEGPPDDEPALGLSSSFVLTRTIRDAAHLLDALRGRATRARNALPAPRPSFAESVADYPSGLRIAWATHPGGHPADPACADAVRGVAERLEGLGHHVSEAAPRTSWDDLASAYSAAMFALVAHDVESLSRAAGAGDPAEALEPTTRVVADAGRELTASDLLSALQSFAITRRDVGAFFQDFDVLLLPANPRLGVPIGETVALDGRQSAREIADAWRGFEGLYMFNVTGGPAISLPLATSQDGLPIGIQLGADVGREDVLLRLGAQLEASLPWESRQPRVHAASLPRSSGGH